jgi:hypothetical protein
MRAIGFLCLFGLALAVSLPASAGHKAKGKDIGAARNECNQELAQGHWAHEQEMRACVHRKMKGR